MLSIPSPQTYAEIDKEAVAQFNARYGGTNFELQVKRGAKCGGGDILNAKVLVLYANPGYNPKVDKQKPVYFPEPLGWPLKALHQDAAKHMPGAHRWLSSALHPLITRYGAQFVAQNLATINIVPWSSTSYHASCSLPSREIQLDVARHAAKHGALLISVRADKAWRPLLDEFPDQVIFTRNPRVRHISPGNLGSDNWERVIAVLDAVR